MLFMFLQLLKIYILRTIYNSKIMTTEETFQQFIQEVKKPLHIAQFKQLATKYKIIDTRVQGQMTGLVKGSYWLPGQKIMTTWLEYFLRPEEPYIFVCDRQELDEVLERFVMMGYFNCMGQNNFNMKLYDGEKEYMTLRNWRELGDNEKKQFVDVRSQSEWKKTGVVRGAMLIELDKLDHDSENKLSQLRKLSKRRLIVVNCGSGQRAKLAASILCRHGICPVILIEAIEDFPNIGLRLVSVQESQEHLRKRLEKLTDESQSQDENKAEKQCQCDNCNRMAVQECYDECLKNKTPGECKKECLSKKKHRKGKETTKMQHSENKNMQQASKMRITPSKLSSQQRHFKQVNQEAKVQQEGQSQLSKVISKISEHDYSSALNQLNQLIAKSPEDSQLLINRAICHIKLNELSDAEKDLNQSIEKDHLNFIAYFNLASLKLLYSNQEKENKLQALQNIYCSLSCMYMKRGSQFRKDQDLLKSIDLAPTNIEATSLLSLMQLEKGHLKGCLDYLNKIDKLTDSKNQTIKQLISNVEKKIDAKAKSSNPQSSKQLTESTTSMQEVKPIVEHFGSSQFGQRLVGRTVSFSTDSEINQQIEERIREWNQLYLEIMKIGQVEVSKADQMQSKTIGSDLGIDSRRTVWIMD